MKKKTKKLVRKAARAVAGEVRELAANADVRRVVVAGAVRWAGRRVLRKTIRVAAAGVGVAAVAVPLGVYATRRLRGQD